MGNYQLRFISLAVLGLSVGFGVTSIAKQFYTKEELERKSHGFLVELVLDLQKQLGGPGGGDCKTFKPMEGGYGTILERVNTPGYSGHGTLKWPNGKTFMRNTPGYSGHHDIFYPDNALLRKNSPGYSNDRTLYWPTGKTLRKHSPGYQYHQSIYHADGEFWLIHNPGYSNHLKRFGGPTETHHAEGYKVHARLTEENSVKAELLVPGDGWSIRVEMEGATQDISVTECFD